MRTINFFLHCQDIAQYPLEEFDHLWILECFKRCSTSALYDDRVQKILRHYMPAGFAIGHTVRGRPYIKSSAACPVAFSISHTEDLAVVLIGKEEPLGVDVERIKERPYMEKIAKRYFHSSKKPSLLDFYECWTACEAFIKAMDMTLAQALSSIHLSKTEPKSISLAGKTSEHRIDSALINEHFLVSACRKRTTARALIYFKSTFDSLIGRDRETMDI